MDSIYEKSSSLGRTVTTKMLLQQYLVFSPAITLEKLKLIFCLRDEYIFSPAITLEKMKLMFCLRDDWVGHSLSLYSPRTYLYSKQRVHIYPLTLFWDLLVDTIVGEVCPKSKCNNTHNMRSQHSCTLSYDMYIHKYISYVQIILPSYDHTLWASRQE